MFARPCDLVIFAEALLMRGIEDFHFIPLDLPFEESRKAQGARLMESMVGRRRPGEDMIRWVGVGKSAEPWNLGMHTEVCLKFCM